MSASREVAIDALVRVEGGAYAHVLVPRLLARRRGLSARDRAHVTELVHGTIRMQRALDHQLAQVSARPLPDLDPVVRAALRLGAYQLHSGVAPHAAVAETVAAVPARARGYVNGVLRALARRGPPWPWPAGDGVEAVGVRTSHPDWIVETLVRELGRDDALRTLALADQPPPVTLRVNPLRASVEEVERELRAGGARVGRGALVPDALVVHGAGDVGALPAVRDGRATPQDQASQAVVAALDPRPGERVLDVAAAPGGKAGAAAERMGDTGLVLAADRHPGRARTVARAVARLGLRGVRVAVADGRQLPVRTGAFDRVLLDAPCSGLGVLRRRPDARWRVRPGDVEALAGLQRALLLEAARAVRPGGRLVYSVCTLTAAETVAIDEFAAEALGDFVALAPPPAPWVPLGRGARLAPCAAGTDGMYVLVLERAASGPG
ncbi:MAG: ribosomal RNA small subunit methyltransferase B [Acidimicrobiia bacterium]|nr:MAG: ribosomal RNA small subunit methyltransferase B [Acidimicrobiia bacterium]